MNNKFSVSVIIPFFDEEEAVRTVIIEVLNVLKKDFKKWEILAINDGSQDKTYSILKEMVSMHKNLKVISFASNAGQTAALMAGIDYATNDIIVGMDGDGQNDPKDIITLVKKINEGISVVSGWRKKRKDRLFSRRLPSIIANKLISIITKVPLNDYGCSLKAYRKEIIKSVNLYGEMHRFIPIYASWQGGKIAEVEVNHRIREGGKSKYGIGRTFKVLLDLFVVVFLKKYLTKPIYLFGFFAFFSFGLSALAGLYAIYLKIIGTSLILTPLPLVAVMFFITGIISVLLGLVAEILVRTYFESQNRRVYSVKNLHNISEK